MAKAKSSLHLPKLWGRFMENGQGNVQTAVSGILLLRHPNTSLPHHHKSKLPQHPENR